MQPFPSVNLWLFGACALLFAPSATAEWTVCNKTGYPVVFAMGYQSKNDQWVSEGWWHIDGGHCADVIKQDLRKRYYYYYAEHEEIGGKWGGDYTFCVSHNSFTIVGAENCEKRSYEKRGFRKLDTRQSTFWTINLTDN